MKPGDVFITRNANEEDNTSPGYWNHVAICGGKMIIEAQEEPNEVILTTIETFYNRYPRIIVLRHKDSAKAVRAANAAMRMVGTKYRKIASIFNILRRSSRGENCVSVVRKAYKEALGYDPGWRIPDDVYMEVEKGNFILLGNK